MYPQLAAIHVKHEDHKNLVFKHLTICRVNPMPIFQLFVTSDFKTFMFSFPCPAALLCKNLIIL